MKPSHWLLLALVLFVAGVQIGIHHGRELGRSEVMESF